MMKLLNKNFTIKLFTRINVLKKVYLSFSVIFSIQNIIKGTPIELFIAAKIIWFP